MNAKSIVKSAGTTLAVLWAVQGAAAGPQALAPWFERLPAPPKSVAEAEAGVRFDGGRVELATDPYAAYGQQLAARREALERDAQAAAASGEAAAHGMQQDLSAAAGEDISSPEFQAKLERMSDAEKMAFAMRMNGQLQKSMGTSYGGATFAGKEPPAVQAAQTAFVQYQQQLGMQLSQNPLGSTQLVPSIEQAHRELDERLSRDAAACLAGGDAAQAKSCLQTRSAACWDQHIALAGRQLASLQSAYNAQLTRDRKAAAEADRVLAPAQYGALATSYSGRTQLISYQSQILGSAEPLLQMSKSAWLDVGAWGAGKRASAGEPLSIISGAAPSCGYESRFGRDGSSGGRSGSSRPATPAGKAAKGVQDGARKVLNWLGH